MKHKWADLPFPFVDSDKRGKALEPGLRVRCTGMGIVFAPGPSKVALRIAAAGMAIAAVRCIILILWNKGLHRSPGLNQGTVNREVRRTLL